MAELLTDKVLDSIGQVEGFYHRLIILAGPAGSGKTTTLREVCERIDAPLLNVNLELSRRMLDLTERQRMLKLPRLLSEIVDAFRSSIILLDNIELLFDVTLKQNPLKLLQGLSRNKTVVASWNGLIGGKYLTYATPDHPEYNRYPLEDFLVVSSAIVE